VVAQVFIATVCSANKCCVSVHFYCFLEIKMYEALFICSKTKIYTYRVSIKSFPDYKHLLQENYVEYKLIGFTIKLVPKKKLLELHFEEKMFVFHVVFL
jgi:hypothetical protein